MPGINTVADEIDLAAFLVNSLPPDEDYNYFDEESGFAGRLRIVDAEYDLK